MLPTAINVAPFASAARFFFRFTSSAPPIPFGFPFPSSFSFPSFISSFSSFVPTKTSAFPTRTRRDSPRGTPLCCGVCVAVVKVWLIRRVVAATSNLATAVPPVGAALAWSDPPSAPSAAAQIRASHASMLRLQERGKRLPTTWGLESHFCATRPSCPKSFDTSRSTITVDPTSNLAGALAATGRL